MKKLNKIIFLQGSTDAFLNWNDVLLAHIVFAQIFANLWHNSIAILIENLKLK
jgi:hypothetical protein